MKILYKFCSKTQISVPEKINWFPGHMYRGFNSLKDNIKHIDIFLEIRDARIPISSKNIEIDREIRMRQKQKIILFNKFDLCNGQKTMKLINQYKSIGIQCMEMTCKEKNNMKSILDYARSKKPTKYPTVGLWMMVGGVPNVGKSTFLNQLRHQTSYLFKNRKKIVQSAPIPCTTKNTLGFKISDNPLAYLIDTPGICVPKIYSDEIALKLSLVGCINDKIAGKDIIVDYMIKKLNQENQLKYLQRYKLESQVDNVGDLVMKARQTFQQIEYDNTLDMILKDFRKGELGKITLDDSIEVEDEFNEDFQQQDILQIQ